ncbi:MAG: BREX-2 system phosphatase PglZ, partial [Dietzia sp.]|nr:BREX-2 system phosphatase PglZ [Dietzia sp.]
MTASASLPDADLGAIKGLIQDLRGKGHRHGVVAVAAIPVWSGADEMTVDGQRVRIAAAPSVLAIRDAIRLRNSAHWVVILTDQPWSGVPTGVAEHLVTNRLRNLDPFPLLRNAFAASEQEFGLLGDQNVLARAMLREVGDKPTPAPGGVLTNDHVFAELARARFGLAPVDFTPHHVAVWSADPVRTEQYASWSSIADPSLVDQFLGWLSRRLGDLGPVLVDTWREQGPAQIVPLGLIAGLAAASAVAVEDSADAVTRVRTRLEMEIGNVILAENQLAAWGAVASLAVAAAADPSSALTSAEAWVPKLQAGPLVARSDVLPSALSLRITAFAKDLAAVVRLAAAGVAAVELAAVENAWAAVRAHRDARVDTADAPRDVRVGAAALRLLRRNTAQWPRPETLADWLGEYRQDLSWVDSVVNSAYIGAGDPQLADTAHRLIDATRARRARLDREFAAMLAVAGTERQAGANAGLYIEDVLDRVVAPLTARPSGGTGAGLGIGAPSRTPVLLVVADGMDVATSNDVVADAGRGRPQWHDCVPSDEGSLTALAVLPT